MNGRSVDVKVEFDTEYNVGGSIIIPADKTVTGILLFEVAGYWTSHSPWTCEGRPLISPHKIDVNDKMLKTDLEKISLEVTYIPHELGYSSYYFIISQNIKSLKLGKPTMHTVGAQLFLKFVNTRPEPVNVKFDSEYAAGKGIILSPTEVVSGIILFDETNHWRVHTPWSCEGMPLSGNSPTSVMM